jgi:diguanylate cyclase
MMCRPATPDAARRGVRRAYFVGSLLLLAVYPLLSTRGREIDFVVVSISAIPALVVGMHVSEPSQRRPWRYLVAGMTIVVAGNVIELFHSGPPFPASTLLEAAGDVLVLAAALSLVLRHGPGSLGGVIDATIVALALGGVLWEVVLADNLVPPYDLPAQKLNMMIVVFTLAGVLGALVRLVQISARPPRALWLLIAALALALLGNIVQALSSLAWLQVAATMMFMATYGTLGMFGLEPSATQLTQPGDVRQEDELSAGRLVFLWAAVAAVPVVLGARALAGVAVDGLLLTVGGAVVAVLVMVRIALLSFARDRAERALRFEASHDPLTGLPNRREFLEQLGSDLSGPRRSRQQSVVFFCDLDGFKSVNDRMGHGAGDALLIEVGRRLRASVRLGDVVSRFGGDEFVILLRDYSPSDVASVRDRIADVLSRPITLLHEQIIIGASIGMAVATGDRDADALIRRADHAMYEAKRNQPTTPGIRIVAV